MTDPAAGAGRELARLRGRLLKGRGPGASEAEVARHTRDRPALGAVPPPVERALTSQQGPAGPCGHTPAGPQARTCPARPPRRVVLGSAAGPVPADHPRARVRREPVRQRAGLPAGQHVDRPPGAGVDQDGAVDVAAAQRESSTPRALGAVLTAGSGKAMTSRSSVLRCTVMPSAAASWVPARLQCDLGQ